METMAYIFCFFEQTKNLKHGDVSAVMLSTLISRDGPIKLQKWSFL